MKKKLNTSAMENELKQGSVFFQKRPVSVSAKKEPKTPYPLPSSKPKHDKVPSSSQPNNELTHQSTDSVDLSRRLDRSSVEKKLEKKAETAVSPLPSRPTKGETAKRTHEDHLTTKIQDTERNSVRFSVRNNERSEIRTDASSIPLPLKRGTKRYSFEFYVDQLDRLRRIKIEEGLKGRNLNLSEIVRIALDEYLEKIGL